MTHLPRPRVWLRLIGLTLALFVIALIGAACIPATLPAPAATSAPAPAVAKPPAATAGPTASLAPVQQGSQEAGPSLAKSPAAAKTHHYQGDPNATVVLIEISDFQ
ncbi:MAG: hypothetical protein NT169_24200 [Chloroflexi bacterium]|nr:hypothetical protein [Chloroflexota bacterium]